MTAPARRRLLAAVGTALSAAAIGGCLDGSNGTGADDDPSPTNGTEVDDDPSPTNGTGTGDTSNSSATSSEPERPDRALWSFREDDPESSANGCVSCEGITEAPAIADGCVYVPGQDLYALDRTDGSRSWRHETPVPVAETPVVRDGTVYAVAGVPFDAGGRRYRTYAIDAANGDVDWEYGTDGSVYQSVLGVGPDSAYLATYQDEAGPDGFPVYAVDREEGTLEWKAETGRPRNAVVRDGTVFVGSSGGLTAFDAGTGDRLWRQDENRSGLATVVGESILHPSEGDLRAFERDGSTAWQFETEGTAYEYVVDGETAYAATFSEGVYAIDATTGDRRWHHDPGRIRGLTVDRGRVYVALEDAVLSIEDGTERWRWESPWRFPGPSVGGGGVFVTEPTDGETEVVSISADDGDERWRETLTDEDTSSTVADGTLYLGEESGRLSAFPSDPNA